MTKVSSKNKNSANSVLTHKRKNGVKAALIATGAAIGVGTPTILSTSSCSNNTYITAYCDGTLQVGLSLSCNIHVTAVGVTLPTSGSDGISNLPNGVSGEWQEDGIISLSGTPTDAGTKLVKIVVGETSGETSVIVNESLSIYQDIEAYFTGVLITGQEINLEDPDAPKIHVHAVNVTLPEENENGNNTVGNLPEGLSAIWGGEDDDGNRIINLTGTPNGSDNFKLVEINVSGVQTQVSISIHDQGESFIQAYCNNPITIGEAIPTDTNIYVRKNGDDIVFPGVGTPANITYSPENLIGVIAIWGEPVSEDVGKIILSGTPTSETDSGTYIAELKISGVDYSSKFTITVYDMNVSPQFIDLSYDKNLFGAKKGKHVTTGAPTIIDENNNNVTANITYVGTLPLGLSFNSNTGEISGDVSQEAVDGEYKVEIICYGNGIWKGSFSTIKITFYILSTDAFILKNGVVIEITNPTGLMVLNSTSTDRLNNTTFTSAAISDVCLIEEIHITPDQTITTAPNNYGRYLCYGMNNLIVADINLPPNITSVGSYFCGYMLYYCTSLTTLPTDFNLPQGITTLDTYFCSHMFYGCSSLPTLPTGFNLPQSITTVGNYFCQYMFYKCTSLTTLPTGFNLPQDITSVGIWFCGYLFYNCSSLPTLPTGFNLPQSITSVGASFCESMFNNCSSLNGLGNSDPRNFRCGANTSSGTDFAKNMFNGCTILNGNPGPNVPATPTNAQLKDGYNIARNN